MFFDSPDTPRDHRCDRVADHVQTTPFRLWLARLVWIVHFGVVTFFVFGWLLPWRWALWGVAIGVPMLRVSWAAMGERCPLTALEEALRGNETLLRSLRDHGESPPNFVTRLLTAILGRPVSQRTSDRVVNGVAWSGFSVAVLRLAF